MWRHSSAGRIARDEVERERAVADRAVLARGVERDALLHEDRVAPAAGGRELLGAQARELARPAAQRARAERRPAAKTSSKLPGGGR